MSKVKLVNYRLLPKESEEGAPVYAMLNRLVESYHEELTNARIALAWCLSWKPDVDGRVTLGKCKRASDLDRELVAYDFVILLQHDFWRNDQVTNEQRCALLDHELCHASVKLDAAGEPLLDERDRVVYRLRKHDVEEFSEIIERHGCYKRDLETFAAALGRANQRNIPEVQAERLANDPRLRRALEALRPKKGSKIESVTITHGDKSVTLTPDDRGTH